MSKKVRTICINKNVDFHKSFVSFYIQIGYIPKLLAGLLPFALLHPDRTCTCGLFYWEVK